MGERKDSWSGKWIKDKLVENEFKKIKNIGLLSSNLVNITRDDGITIKAATMSQPTILKDDLEKLLDSEDVDCVINISKEPYIGQDALIFAEEKGFIIGDFGDLMRIINQETPSDYINPEVKFITRGLSQHSRVSSIFRLDNRRYEINRYGLEPVIIVALNDYDLTADSVRSAKEKFGDFQAILTSNPNCRVSSQANEVAEHLKINIFNWRTLLGELNRKWN